MKTNFAKFPDVACLSALFKDIEWWATSTARYNVGGIKLAFENKLRTNQLRSVSVYTGGEIRTRLFDNAFEHGDPIGTFMY